MSDSEEDQTKSSKKPSKPKPQPEKKDYKCPQCDSIVEVYPSPEATYITIITSCLLIIFLRLWSVFLLPFIIPLSKALVIHCAKCDAVLDTHQPFGISSLQDKVLSISCGECALVVSRSYLLSGAAIISCILFLLLNSNTLQEASYVFIPYTWQDYISDCGGEVLLKNGIKAAATFSAKYEGKTVNWDGYLMKATENLGWFRGDHAVVILVKMLPSESDIHADLILSMDDLDFEKNKAQLALLDRGNQFEFNATFMTVGNEQQLHHLHAHGLRKMEGQMEIAPHVHSINHRYSLKIQTGTG